MYGAYSGHRRSTGDDFWRSRLFRTVAIDLADATNRLIAWLRSSLRGGDTFWASWSFILPVAIVLALMVSSTLMVRYDYFETGFDGKTLWDWIQVLGVPVSVVVIAGLLSMATQRAGQRADAVREIDTERARQATLRDYLDRMSDLILNHGLQDSAEDSPVRAVAHARTLGALRSLNGPRKGILVRFLRESRLIMMERPVISLSLADLSGSDLSGADLEGSDLSGANLRDADFYDANLSDVDLSSSVVGDDQLTEARDLVGAIMPDGAEMTEDRWREFKESQL